MSPRPAVIGDGRRTLWRKRPEVRSSLGGLTALAVAASTLSFAAVTQVVEAPSAAAAPVIGQVCGTSSVYGSVFYADGQTTTASRLCVIYVRTSRSDSTLTYTVPTGISTYTVWYVGGGGGGGGVWGGSSTSTWCGRSGNPGTASSSSGQTAASFTYRVGKGGDAGDPPAENSNPPSGTSGSGGNITEYGGTSASGGLGGSTNIFDAGVGGSCSTSQVERNGAWPSFGRGGGETQWVNGNGRFSGQAGSDGAVIVTYTPATPSAPQTPAATPDDTVGVATVTWSAPATNATFASRYVATATSNTGTTQTCSTTRVAAGGYVIGETCQMSGLTPGATYSVTVQAFTALDTGSAISSVSNTFTVPDPPVNTSAPTITGAGGKFAVGTPVTAGTGAWSGDTITGYGYQWQVCTAAADPSTCNDVAGATDDSYTPVLNDAGDYLRVRVTATNQYGSSSAFSVPASAEQITEQPVFTAADPPSVSDVNRPYGTYQFVASGYRVTYAEDDSGLTGLPPGMSIDDTGVLTGTPTQRGTFSYRVTATNDSGSVTTDVLTLTVSSGVASELEITQQPVGGPSRLLLATQPIIRVLDDSGIVVRDDTISVTSTGTIGGSQASGLATVNGVATFTNLTLGGLVDDTYTLTFTAGSEPTTTVTSDPTQVTPGLAVALVITTPPIAAAEAGGVLVQQPVVNILDADTNLVTYDDTTIVTLTPATGGFVGPTQASVATATASGGVATFTGVRFGGPVGQPIALTFTATRNNVGPALADDSADVVSTATGPAYKLIVTTEANSPSASGAVFSTQPVVEQQDMAGNTVTTDPQAVVTATLVEESQPYDVLVGGVTQTTAAGVATFTDLGISGLAGTTYTIRFVSPGLVPADDTVVPSVGAPARLSLTAPNAQASETASYDDTTLNPQPKLQIVDSGNNPTSTAGVVVTASLVSGTGTLYDDTATTDANGLATFTGLALDGLVGTYVLRFSATGYISIDDTVRMLRGAQTVTLNPIGPKVLGDVPFVISATTSSGLRATFSTTTPSVCAVAGNQTVIDDTTGGSVSIIGAGSCTIVASQGGNADYEPAADDSETFTVTKANQATLTLFADDTTATAGQTVRLSTLGGSGTGAVTFVKSADPGGICSVDANTGLVTFTGTGNTCDFTATKAADDDFNVATSAAVTITIPAGAAGLSAQEVAFTSSALPSPVTDDTYVATAESTSGLPVTISVVPGSPTVCTATSGPSPVEVTFISEGTCVLQATQAGDARFAAATPVVQTLLVYDTPADAAAGLRNQSITFAPLENRPLGSPNFRLGASASSTLTVSYTSSTTAVCTVTEGGIVQLIAVGECTIEAAQAGSTAFAAADTVTRSFQVTAGVPGAPRITSTSAGSGSLTVSFTPPVRDGGSPILGYVVQAVPTGGGDTVTTLACTTSPCTITGLTNGTGYTVRMAAVNAVGTGPYSSSSVEAEPRACSPCLGAPGAPGTPGSPQGEQIDDSTVTLTWSQPASLGDDTFVSYDIYYREVGAAWPNTPQVVIVDIDDTTTTITGLTPNVAYEFLIVVVTVANPSVSPPDPNAPNATPITVSIPAAPMAPINVTALYVTDTSIQVAWGFSPNDGGSPITGYSTTLNGASRCTAPVLDDTTATATCDASGLTTGTTYSIAVTASNAVGTSAPASISYTTPGTPPNPGPTPPSPLPPAPPLPPGPQPLPPTPPTPSNPEGIENGRPIPLTPSPEAQDRGGLTVTGPNFALTVTAFDTTGRIIRVGPDVTLHVVPGGQLLVSGGIYSFNSDVSAYLLQDNSNGVGAQSVSPIASGFGRTSSLGRFTVAIDVPRDTAPGMYILQVNGYSLLAQIRSVAIAVVVTELPMIDITGHRHSVGRAVVQGATEYLAPGTRVTPMVRLSGQSNFRPGTGIRVVSADGSFAWQRKVSARKTLTVYFMVVVDDNRVESNHLRLRPS